MVWEDKAHVAVLDINPCNDGHVLLIPRKHSEYIFDLPDQEYQSIWSASKKLAGPLTRAMGAKRTGIVVEGFGVNHLHIHLIPVHGGGDLDPNKQKRASDEELQRVKDALVPILADV
jgi:histidine triad (HIT) family protein